MTDTVRSYLQAWNDHDGNAVASHLAPGGSYVDPILPGPLKGPELAGFVEALAAAFPDMVFAEDALIGEGDLVVISWRMTGTNSGPLPGFAAGTGQRCELPGVDIIKVGPEGIESVTGYFDQKTFFESIGMQVTIAPPA
jgi:steroid delta-isomerase-like uncharacterized protein